MFPRADASSSKPLILSIRSTRKIKGSKTLSGNGITKHSSRWLGSVLILSGSLLGTLWASPVLAHKTVVAGDVAGTWHVEPNHNPKAGEPAIAWVALTREGGDLISLTEAACQMQVYRMPRQPEDLPILEPPVEAIAAEQYDGIPAADIVFPQAGLYQLQLNCTPIEEASFTPFELQYDVTVAAGNPAPAPTVVSGTPLPPLPGEEVAPTQGERNQQGGVGVGGAIALLSIVGVGSWLWINRRKV